MTSWHYRHRLLAFLSVILLLSIASLLFYSYNQFTTKIELTSPLIIKVEKGSSLTKIVQQFYEKGLISNPDLIITVMQLMGLQKKIKAGQYELKPDETLFDLVNKIAEGEIKLFSFTIVEGIKFSEIIKNLRNEPNIDSTEIESMDRSSLLKTLGIDRSSPEGLFFPDTYHYAADSSGLVLLNMSRKRMDKVLDLEWNNRGNNLPFKTKYQGLIMASIIEKETSDESERNTISGVFSNRMQLGMRLQSDPTVIYGIGNQYDGNIKKVHLLTKTPYNTYKVNGLPPTPIAMPGQHSIRAAMNPKKTKYLYFVSMGNGSHKFSTSFEEHNEAVIKYQKTRLNGKR